MSEYDLKEDKPIGADNVEAGINAFLRKDESEDEEDFANKCLISVLMDDDCFFFDP